MNGSGHLSMIIIFSISILITTQTASAQVDILLDCDGTNTTPPPASDGCSTSQEVTPGSTLTPFPTGVPTIASGIPAGGLDWFDRDNSKTWTPGDDLHSEALATCPTANVGMPRNGIHDSGDCPILDLDGNLGLFIHPGSGFTADVVDCDLETGGSPSGFANPLFGFPIPPPSCQDIQPTVLITFFDLPGPGGAPPDGFWNDGEDIILDVNGNLIFDPPMVVGGKFLDVDKTALILAGTQYTTSWLIPALVATIGFGLIIARKI